PIKLKLVDAFDPHGEIYAPADVHPSVASTAREWHVDANRLADATDSLWRQDRDAVADVVAAIRDARQETGLTVQAISRWENAGRDSSTYRGFDVKARELAGRYPALQIGHGYDPDQNAVDEPDSPALLWDRLREPTPTVGRKYSDVR